MFSVKVLQQQGLALTTLKKCPYCQEKEYPHHSSLYKHKIKCDKNPMSESNKKRKTEAEEEAEEEMDLHRKAANRVFKSVMATDCTDKVATKKKMKHLEPLASGLLYQKLVDMDTQFHRDTEDYEAKKRENDKVKLVIGYLDGGSSPQVSSSSSSAAGGGGGGGGAASGGGGIMGYFSSAKK